MTKAERREYARAYREKNREALNAYKRQYFATYFLISLSSFCVAGFADT